MELEEEEEKKSSRGNRGICVFIQKSNLREKRKSGKKTNLKKEVWRELESGDAGSRTAGEKRKSEDEGLGENENPKKMKRCSFYKVSNLDYMKKHKSRRLDFLCKHTIRYVPKSEKEKISKPLTKSAISDWDGYNPFRQFSFPY